MEYLYEKVAYLKGLADGLDIDESTKEGRLLIKMIDILEDFADAIVELDEDTEEIVEYIEAMDEDLANVEEDLYEDDEYDDCFDDEDEVDFIEIECPNCLEDVYVDKDLLYDDEIDVVCPRCHETIDLDELEECCCDDCCDVYFDEED